MVDRSVFEEKMKQSRRKTEITLFIFIFLSILLHLFLGILFYLLPKQRPQEKTKPESQVVWVKPELPQMPSNPQIADIEKPAIEKRPQKSRFVGQYDSAVKEEKVAPAKPKPKVIKENPLSEEHPPKKVAEQQKPAPEKEELPAEKIPEKKLGDLALKPQDVMKEIKKKEETSKPKPTDFKTSSPGLEFGRPSTPDLFVHDYYPDYKIGGKTYLNVMKLQDIGYFVKMKRILKMRWNPVPPIRNYALSNRLSMGKIECVIGVSLDASGKIGELFVIRSSGMGGYDDEALQTLRDSSPFSSPPSEFMKSGQLRMSWTFTVYL
jgi:TonB family protein